MAEFEAGRRGDAVRSDCWVGFTPASSGGIRIESTSKVESMYGTAIRKDAERILAQLGVEHGGLEIKDAGALPFVLAARIEAAIRRWRLREAGAPLGSTLLEVSERMAKSLPGGPAGLRWLPEVLPGARRASSRDRFRRSRLYLPGSEPKFMLNAGLHKPDGIILDLEDSVAPSEKDTARILVRNALRVLDFGTSERMVRINQLPLGLEDLEEIIPQNVHLILIPKCESAGEVIQVAEKIAEIQGRSAGASVGSSAGTATGVSAGTAADAPTGRSGAADMGVLPEGTTTPQPVFLMPILESALGCLRALEIASAHPSVVALTVGLEDYTADLGTQRTAEGRESFFARCMVVNAAKAAGLQAIDTVFSDVADMDALYKSVLEAKSLGFEGKGCIHPRQIEVVHRGFAPEAAELEKARKIVEAFRAAEARGEGVVSLGTKMIDAPVVKRALKTVRLAETLGAGWSAVREEAAGGTTTGGSAAGGGVGDGSTAGGSASGGSREVKG